MTTLPDILLTKLYWTTELPRRWLQRSPATQKRYAVTSNVSVFYVTVFAESLDYNGSVTHTPLCASTFRQNLGEASELTTHAQRVRSGLDVYSAHAKCTLSAHVNKIQRTHSVLLAGGTNGPRMQRVCSAHADRMQRTCS